MYFHFLENGGLNFILINDKVSLGQGPTPTKNNLKNLNA